MGRRHNEFFRKLLRGVIDNLFGLRSGLAPQTDPGALCGVADEFYACLFKCGADVLDVRRGYFIDQTF